VLGQVDTEGLFCSWSVWSFKAADLMHT